jgi:hypothetical protein
LSDVANPELPPTNNDAETALRHAVIARRISFGTRTDEGSRAYAAILSVTETCRRRKIDAWAFVTNGRRYSPKRPKARNPSCSCLNLGEVNGYARCPPKPFIILYYDPIVWLTDASGIH